MIVMQFNGKFILIAALIIFTALVFLAVSTYSAWYDRQEADHAVVIMKQ